MILTRFSESNQYSQVNNAFAAECSVSNFSNITEISFFRIFISEKCALVLCFRVINTFDKYLIFEILFIVCRIFNKAI